MPREELHQMTLGTLLGEYPIMVRWALERDLDFCCGGNLTLDEICRRKGVDGREFFAEIETQIDDPELEGAPLPTWQPHQTIELIEFILTRFHETHRRDFPVIFSLLNKVEKGYGAEAPQLLQLGETLRALIWDLEPHMRKEEQILFPMIQALFSDGAVTQAKVNPLMPMLVMRREHDQAGELLDQARALADEYNPPTWGCGALKALYENLRRFDLDIRLHIHLENNLLFPFVERRLA